ncbi:MAG: putative PurR-regulated permease PerM [Candidatus Azotimanducaceae bacterium]|jgi:predicted PurR-regulated permease PerM
MKSFSATEKMVMLASIALLLALIYLLQPILTPFLVGMAIAYLGDPLVDRLERFVGRTGGVVIVFVLITLIIMAGFLLLLPMLLSEVASLIQSVPSFIRWLQETTSPFLLANFGVDPFGFNLDTLAKQLKDDWQQVGNIAKMLLGQATASGYALLVLITNLALIPVVSFYLMRDWDMIVVYVRDMLPRDSEQTAVHLFTESDEVLSAFLRGQMLVMALLGAIYSIGLMIVGLELALLIGMLAGLASIVPYLGFIVGLSAASIAVIIQYQELYPLLYVVIVFGIGQAMEGMVLTPLLVGDRIGLHPVAVIFAILAGGQLFGFTGILLALPVAAVIMVFARYYYNRYVESDYYNLSDAPSDSGEKAKSGEKDANDE